MDEIYVNVEYDKSQVSIRPSTPAPGPSSPRSRPHVAVAVSLGLLSVLLLAGLVCLGVLMHASAAELSSIKANLTERLQVSGDMLSSVSAERDQLKDNFTALKDNFTALKDNFTALTQEKDGLQLLLKQKKTCPEGWTMFRGSCYLLSTRDGSWENGRKDCRDQGADLVIIDSLEEQKFLSSINRRRSWIGLSDKDIEGTWKWIDGTPLTAAYWYRDANVVEPNNGGGGSTVEEDCAEMNPDLKTQNSWNDLPCNTALRWIYSQPVAVAVKFLSSIIKSQTWIGLSDRDIEGTWKWIDGTLLTAAYWSTQPNGPQPDNGGGDPRWGEEDCAHIELEQNPQRNWNDLRCDAVMRWICEKLP